jgi:2'-5' RNA ligase
METLSLEETNMTSYFFAVTPPEPTLRAIESFRARWGHPHHNVEPHMTIKPPFPWSDAPETFLAPLRPGLAALRPFTARLGAPARFGDAVLYLTVNSTGMKELHLATIAAVPTNPADHDGESYTPHLTLAVTRFGISAEGLERMEAEARAELSAFAPFEVTALRCYHRAGKDDRWHPLCDLPLGPL